jgi:hypothetical protein
MNGYKNWNAFVLISKCIHTNNIKLIAQIYATIKIDSKKTQKLKEIVSDFKKKHEELIAKYPEGTFARWNYTSSSYPAPPRHIEIVTDNEDWFWY